MSSPRSNTPYRVLFASLIGTTIEFFDFYIYATAAVLVFPTLFFPSSDPTSAMLQSFATFALAFFARPVGSALFGHFGDRIGRKATLVAALMTMGVSTVLIGLLPTYAQIGVAAPLLLALCRLGQGLGLGGEWGGAVLLAVENAPPGRRAWYGMFPQLGAPLGFLFANGSFLLLSATLDPEQFMAWGWRVPFVASAVLVVVGLWVRLSLEETPVFAEAIARNERVRVPILEVLRRDPLELLLGTLAATVTFVVFYLITVFTLGWATLQLGYSRMDFLQMQMGAVLMFALFVPVSALLADRWGALRTLALAAVLIALFGLLYGPWFVSVGRGSVFALLATGFVLIGLTYGPLGTALAARWPAAVRYTGASMTFNLAGIVGASLAPYIATWLAQRYGIVAVGYYLSAAAMLSLAALLWMARRPRSD